MKQYWNIAVLLFLFHCAGSRTVSDIRINRELSRPQFEIQAIQKVNLEVQYVRKKWIFNTLIPFYSETLLNTEKGDIVISESVDLHKSPLVAVNNDYYLYSYQIIAHSLMYSDFFIADGKSRGAKAYLLSKAISSVPETTVLIDPSFSEQCNNVQGWPLFFFIPIPLLQINESSCTLKLRGIAGKTVFKG